MYEMIQVGYLIITTTQKQNWIDLNYCTQVIDPSAKFEYGHNLTLVSDQPILNLM